MSEEVSKKTPITPISAKALTPKVLLSNLLTEADEMEAIIFSAKMKKGGHIINWTVMSGDALLAASAWLKITVDRRLSERAEALQEKLDEAE